MRNYFELFWELFITDFKLRYKHSILGLVWSVLKPLSIYTMLYIVWSAIFHTGQNFALFLLLGVITINFFNEGVTFGLQSLFNKAHIILKINFPREIAVLSSVAVALLNFIINLSIFFVYWEFANGSINILGILLVLFALSTLFLFIIALSLFLSIWSVKFYDIRHLVDLGLQLLFWVTPVVYNIEIFSENIAKYIRFNPLTWILKALRTGFLDSGTITLNNFIELLPVFFGVILLLLLGFFFFKKQIPKIAEFF